MSCPRCGSNNLWHDNLWWGCDSCGYAGNPSGGTMTFAKDRQGLARTVREVNEHAGWTPFSYLHRIEPDNDD